MPEVFTSVYGVWAGVIALGAMFLIPIPAFKQMDTFTKVVIGALVWTLADKVVHLLGL